MTPSGSCHCDVSCQLKGDCCEDFRTDCPYAFGEAGTYNFCCYVMSICEISQYKKLPAPFKISTEWTVNDFLVGFG